MFTSEEAFCMVEQAGIIKNKQTFLRYVREGKLKGYIRHKREGYRFKPEDVQAFIEVMASFSEKPNPGEELERLRRENENLKHKLKLPDTVIQAENQKLAEKLSRTQVEKDELNRKLKDLETKRYRAR